MRGADPSPWQPFRRSYRSTGPLGCHTLLHRLAFALPELLELLRGRRLPHGPIRHLRPDQLTLGIEVADLRLLVVAEAACQHPQPRLIHRLAQAVPAEAYSPRPV